MAARYTLVGVGEALFDMFPDGPRLGGAPLNCTVHAHRLLSRHRGEGVVVSRVGQDELGDELQRALRELGLTTEQLQSDPDYPTGEVWVTFRDGEPSFDIASPAAWDRLQFDPQLESLARRASAVCFGTLAQRNSQSRSTIQRLVTLAARAVRLLDVNLRQKELDVSTLERSLDMASDVKLSEGEMVTIARPLGWGRPSADDQDSVESAARALLERFELNRVVLTRGARGTVLFTPGGRFEGEPARYETPAGEEADPVGAGDACAAAILVGAVLGMTDQATVNLANHAGAAVAARSGATPELPDAVLDMVGRS